MIKRILLNSKGEKITLDSNEQAIANHIQMQLRTNPIYNQKQNSLGYEIDVTSLTTIIKQISEQRFFEIAPADYMPIKVGEGAFSSNLITYTSFSIADDFETGIINTGANNSRLAETDAGIAPVSVKVINWAKAIGWSLFDLKEASKSGNWDLVTAKESARKKNWDLGIQKIAFLGSTYDSNILGLLTQSDVTKNVSTRITKAISSMTAAEINTFVAGVIEDYRENCKQTVYPSHFIMPENDYNGLGSYPDATFPVKNRYQFLMEAFELITQKKGTFKILPLAYANKDNPSNVLTIGGYNRYTLLNYDVTSGRMDIPVNYTSTLANSLDNFTFQNAGYGQFTGFKAYRPLEMMYFDWQ